MAVWSESTLIDAYLSRRIDSEFFRPAYIDAEQQTRRCNAEDLGRLGRFIPGPFGSAFHVKNYDFQSPYRYLRGRDIKPFFILDDDNRYVPEADFQRLKDYAVQHDDLMISVVGTLGNVAVCTSYDTPAIFSCKSTLFRSFGANPYYLLAYLNCHQGQLCLLRRQRGAVQTGLNIEDLKTISIPRFDNEVESEIAFSVRFAHKALRDSKEHYTQAQHLIESELGLDKLNFQKPVGYKARLSDTVTSGRFDADYYQPQFAVIRQIVKNYPNGYEPLIHIATPLKPNVDPSKTPNQIYSYIELSDINASLGTADGFVSKFGKDLPSRARRQVQYGDVIASAVVGSINKAAIIDHAQDGFIASTGFFHLRPRTVSPEYLLMLVRSQCVCMQFQQQSTGGILSAVPDSRLKHVIVPKLPERLQQEITTLVIQSHEANKKSQELLAQAKTSVEQLIEEAVRS